MPKHGAEHCLLCRSTVCAESVDLPPALDGDSAEARRTQVRQVEQALQAHDPKWLLRLPLLGDLLSLPIEDNPTTAAFDTRMRQEALAALVIDIVRRAASERPLVLVIEDSHWLDEASRSLILALARVVASAPLLLLLVQRPSVPNRNRWLAIWPRSPTNSVSGWPSWTPGAPPSSCVSALTEMSRN